MPFRWQAWRLPEQGHVAERYLRDHQVLSAAAGVKARPGASPACPGDRTVWERWREGLSFGLLTGDERPCPHVRPRTWTGTVNRQNGDGKQNRAIPPAEDDFHSRRQAWRSEHAHVEADLARTVMLLDTIAQVERNVATTLQALARTDGTESAERRLRLAQEAIQGAQAAIDRSEHLQQQAHRWQEHTEVARLHHALDRAGGLLADLARAEKDIADSLTSLASQDGSVLAAQRQQLAKQALTGARRADARAQALRELAATSAAGAQP